MTRTAQSHGTSEQILKLAPAAKALQNELTDFSVHFLFCHMHVTNGFCEVLQCAKMIPMATTHNHTRDLQANCFII